MENYPSETISQRDVYKIVERISLGKFNGEVDFLKSLVEDIVDQTPFEIVGGRVWEINPDLKSYSLKYQYGKVATVPDHYTFKIEDQPIVADLFEERTALNTEHDPVLVSSGISLYSITGLGEIIKTSNGKFFKYLLGFNANEMPQSFFEILTIISSVATVTIRNLSSSEEQKRIRRDLVKASEIQRNLLPEHYLEFRDYKIYGVCIPDSDVGGDYFDYLKNMDDEEERIGIVVSDAASKGLPAAIQSLFVSGAIRMARAFSPKISLLFSRLNTLIYDTFPYERFVTMFYCELSMTSNRLVLYANAGHCAPIHYRYDKDKISFLESTGGLLGIVRNQKFNVENIIMRKGDIMAIYTDGITDCMNDEGEVFGEERLINLIRENRELGPKELTVKVIEEVQKFGSDTNYSDDRTLIIVKRDLV
ncbi:MAG TPA: PP2C family protein-serine/threonine phosphatase [Candidatus Kapabacteria bacterium]|nr:PP2C family protein-serine/threonine phosphatase [Candidatus Kapabacteria bacterium]